VTLTTRRQTTDNENQDTQDSRRENRTDNGQTNIRNQKETYVLTFKDEDAIGTFDGEGMKTIDRWMKNFEEATGLCKWNNIQKIIYAKKLRRGPARYSCSGSMKGSESGFERGI